MRTARTLLFAIGLGLIGTVGCGREESPKGSVQAYDARGARIAPGPDLDAPPNLIVIVIDALRHDAVSPDGTPLPLEERRMPFLAKMADEGVQFTQVASSAPWTLPSMMSLLTGLRPSKHGQNRVDDRWHLPGAVTTLPEVLRAGYGYETAAFVNGLWFKASQDSLLQGFTKQQSWFSLQGLDGTVGKWNEARDSEKPFFLLLHSYDVHEPYGEANHPWPPYSDESPRADPALLARTADPADLYRACFLDGEMGFALRREMGMGLDDALHRYRYRGFAEAPRPDLAAELETAYWDGARWTDGLLEKAHGKLEALGLLQNTLLVVTADHGEAFGEHGYLSHCLSLHDEVIRVPLVMQGPAPFTGGHVVDQSVALMDLIPTFLDWTGAAPLADIDARSVLPLVYGAGLDWCRPVISEERLTRRSTGYDENKIRVSVRTDHWKYIATFDLHAGHVHEEAYDLLIDDEEKNDLGRGTGILPPVQAFGACLCTSVEEVRHLIWSEWDDTQVATSPYGTGPLRAGTPRPLPCQ